MIYPCLFYFWGESKMSAPLTLAGNQITICCANVNSMNFSSQSVQVNTFLDAGAVNARVSGFIANSCCVIGNTQLSSLQVSNSAQVNTLNVQNTASIDTLQVANCSTFANVTAGTLSTGLLSYQPSQNVQTASAVVPLGNYSARVMMKVSLTANASFSLRLQAAVGSSFDASSSLYATSLLAILPMSLASVPQNAPYPTLAANCRGGGSTHVLELTHTPSLANASVFKVDVTGVTDSGASYHNFGAITYGGGVTRALQVSVEDTTQLARIQSCTQPFTYG